MLVRLLPHVRMLKLKEYVAIKLYSQTYGAQGTLNYQTVLIGQGKILNKYFSPPPPLQKKINK